MTVEPRIVEARLGRVSLEQVDVSLRVALRASQAATIRSIAFTDAFVGQVPVWIERVEGDWPLEPGRELVIPQPMQVRIHARDAVGADDLGAIVRKGAVTVRASVEVAIETPWLARLMFMGPTRTLVRDVVLELPIQAGSSYSARWRASAPTSPTPRSAAPRRGWRPASIACPPAAPWSSATAGPSPASPPATRRGRRLGRRPRAARRRCLVEPGGVLHHARGDRAVALRRRGRHALQLGGARLRRDRGAVHIAATADRPALDIDLAVLDQMLPAPAERKLYTLLDGRTRRLRLADRNAASNLVCLQVADASAPAATAAPSPADASASPTGIAAGDVAAFSPGRSLGVVWTSVTPARDDRLRIATPAPSAVVRLPAGERRPRGRPRRLADHGLAGRARRHGRLARASAAVHPLRDGTPSALVGSLHYADVGSPGPVGPTSREDAPTMNPLRFVAAPLLLTVALGGTAAAQPRTVELVATDNMKFSTTTHRGPAG